MIACFPIIFVPPFCLVLYLSYTTGSKFDLFESAMILVLLFLVYWRRKHYGWINCDLQLKQRLACSPLFTTSKIFPFGINSIESTKTLPVIITIAKLDD